MNRADPKTALFRCLIEQYFAGVAIRRRGNDQDWLWLEDQMKEEVLIREAMARSGSDPGGENSI